MLLISKIIIIFNNIYIINSTMKKFKGTGASVGVAYAKAYILKTPKFDIKQKKITNPKTEFAKFKKALEKSVSQLNKVKAIAAKKLGAEKAEIFDAHIQIISDPEIANEVETTVKEQKHNIEYIAAAVFDKYHNTFAAMDDPYFKERAADVIDVKNRLLSNLLDVELPDILNIDKESIIVAHDLTPSETALLNKDYIKGFVTDIGGRTSHAAIMARTMEIPAVLGLKSITSSVDKNSYIAIDGKTGEVEINPKNKKEWQNKIAAFKKNQTELKKYINVKTCTKDGVHVHIEANIGKPEDAISAQSYGCEGIGLFRSEFLYMDNDNWPTEDQQFEAYKKALQACKNQLVVIRTLDIGGDKKLSYFTFPQEMNPFLGYRAIRLCLDKPKMFKTQLRALGRASVYGKLAIMFPMIATIDEFKKAKKMALDCFKQLKKEGHKVSDNIQLGMMVEIPSAAILADKFAVHSDFFSIGTNDLNQYSFACDRMSKEVSYLYQPNNPSLLRMINSTIQGGHSQKRWVGMCGEMAGDVLSVPILLGLGLDAFSMSATSIPQARKIINSLSKAECVELAKQALELETIDQVNALVTKFLKSKKLI